MRFQMWVLGASTSGKLVSECFFFEHLNVESKTPYSMSSNICVRCEEQILRLEYQAGPLQKNSEEFEILLVLS